MNQQQLHAIIHGRVQGVGFRQSTVVRAQAIGCTGWVRNKPDGTVEVVAQGQTEQLERLAQFLRQGPTAARVDDIDLKWQSPQGTFDSFGVRY